MRERPILFKGEMVRAILDGRKTQTRRIVKPSLVEMWDEPRGAEDIAAGYPFVETDNGHISAVELCPFGRAGDRLWVRETWRPGDGATVGYKADFPEGVSGWKPSIHMPRRASRITLEITRVRVERLQDISEEDACAEGCRLSMMSPTGEDNGSYIWGPNGFCELWKSINGAESWDANPWVFVIDFKRLDR